MRPLARMDPERGGMGKRIQKITIKKGLPDWVMTYGDMMSLLLTFFVLIVSFSSMQETKFQQAANSLKDAFGVLATPESVIQFNDPLIPNHNPESREADVLYEVRSVEKMVFDSALENQVEVEIREEGVMFRIDAPFLFESASAELTSAPRALLTKLGGLFQKFPYSVNIEGHTDSLPIRSGRFGSNWELSATRAVAVARYFQRVGVAPANLSATGYGEFRPLADNATPEGREKNRRVEIFLKMDREKPKRQKELPLVDPAVVGLGAVGSGVKNGSVRPIINPVTGRLGLLPPTGK